MNESWRTHNKDNQIRFKTSMLGSGLSDYVYAYVLVERTIAVASATIATPNNANKKVIFKKSVLFTNCISRINNIYTRRWRSWHW